MLRESKYTERSFQLLRFMIASFTLSRVVGASLLWLLCCFLASAQERTVAVTFDDLPAVGTSDPAEAGSINRAILDCLARHHTPATAFVIEKKVQDIGNAPSIEILTQWVRRGHDLGNHSYSHADFDEMNVEQAEREIVLGGKSITEVLKSFGKTPHYFRFPMNHTGDTRAKHDAAGAFLAQHGYTLATSTIENEDYVFNATYLRMLARKDTESAKRLRSEYLAYTKAEIDFYRALNTQVFGYEPPQVMLLHANRLNAEMLEAVLRLFEEEHYSFVKLDRAQADPAFRTPDTFISPQGPMWGYRWAAERGVKVVGSSETEPPAWILEYGKP